MKLKLNQVSLLVAQAVASMVMIGCGGANNDSSAVVANGDAAAQGSADTALAHPAEVMARAQQVSTTTAAALEPASGQAFATRCADTNVIKCVGFDDPADFNIGGGGTGGAYGSNSGILPVGSDYSLSGQDTSIKASGAGSLRFTIPSNSYANTSGSYFTNFSKDLSVQFGAGQEFYVQWRQRFSPEYINTQYTGAGGFKQAIIGTGDQPGALFSSCSTLELPVQNISQRGFPMMYNSCNGSTSHGAYDAFEEPFGAYDFKLQNGRAAPYCLYSQDSTGYFAPKGNCFGYVANEWMTFQVHVQIGQRVGDEFQGSYITLWGARDGKPSELLIKWGPYNLSAGNATTNERYGKVWLLPYNTGKSSAQAHATAYTWYDELVISRSKIADPPY